MRWKINTEDNRDGTDECGYIMNLVMGDKVKKMKAGVAGERVRMCSRAEQDNTVAVVKPGFLRHKQ